MNTLKCFALIEWRPKEKNAKPKVLQQTGDFSVSLAPGDPNCPCDLVVLSSIKFPMLTSVYVCTSQSPSNVFAYVLADGTIYVEQFGNGTVGDPPPISLETTQLRIEVPLPLA